MTLSPILPLSWALAAALLALPAGAQEMACSGVLGPDSSEARLIEAYGADNVMTGDVPGAEGETVLATTVYPNDPARSFQVGWWDEDKREQVAYFTVPANGVAPGGVRQGQTVAEVEALNGQPFTLLGFYWDYGGAASFQDGRLADLPGGCQLSLAFEPRAELPAGTDDSAVVGDIEVPSSEPLLVKLDARVQSLFLSYPDASTEDGADGDGGAEAAGAE
jgi:hypothetical protein